MFDIGNELNGKFNFRVSSATTHRDSFFIFTDKGTKVLKKTSLSSERIQFVHYAKEHLFNKGFENTDRFACALNGAPYINIEGTNYTVANKIEGLECDFNLQNDVVTASKLLARLHNTSKGFIPPQCAKARDDLGKLPFHFSKRLDEIKKLKKIAKKSKSKFDYMFLDCVDYFQALGQETLDELNNSNYLQIVEDTRDQALFCHHDYTHYNIIKNDSSFFVINFDYCCFEIAMYDLANLIRRKMRKCNWDASEAQSIINSYSSIESISNDEFLILKLILKYPQKFWRVANKYFNSRRSWSERIFIEKLNEVVEESQYHKKFIQIIDSM